MGYNFYYFHFTDTEALRGERTCLSQSISVSGSDKIQTQVGLALSCSKAAFSQGNAGGGKEGWREESVGAGVQRREGLAVFLTKSFGFF